ncbi:hypothetical protein CYY_005588 [Polysphondylium violaceum]|uniref:CRAL-TRIO domain-containing protein n=1 Tax=Polysphondylium violaceum TaxID=133409 RepID=A0A8J4UZI2_9MYCE|nr:hypothetical protein CYY_005588 [Polysphondylium violaceum]
MTSTIDKCAIEHCNFTNDDSNYHINDKESVLNISSNSSSSDKNYYLENENFNSKFCQSKYPILKGLTKEEEYKLEEFQKEPIAKGIAPEYLMLFLFAKKLSIEKASQLMENNLEFRKKLELPFPILKKDVDPEIALKCSSFCFIGKRDKLSRSISYLVPSKITPRDYSFKEYLTFMIWNIDQTIHDSSNSHRQGLVIIQDLKNFSLFKNFDYRLNQFLEGKSLENIFPGRIQKIYIVNPPFYLKTLLVFAKTFVKNKIISRVEITKKEKLLEDIDSDQLLSQYGGTLELTYQQYFDSLPLDF